MTIELRLSDVDPPAPEPKRTIYRDIESLPNPVKLGITIRYFNYDDVGLYFRITGSALGYTFGTVNLGLLGSGSNAYINLDEFASRAKPAVGDLPNGEMEENITLTLRAYTDSGYTNLKWTFERIVTVHWINSADAAFTVDELDNFSDGTVQGWGSTLEAGIGYNVVVATDYVLSAPYSYKINNLFHNSSGAECRVRVYKSFTTANRPKVFAIINFRATTTGTNSRAKYVAVDKNTTRLLQIGFYDGTLVHNIPVNKWIRLVVPLPSNTTLELRILFSMRWVLNGSAYGFWWQDDFKIISK